MPNVIQQPTIYIHQFVISIFSSNGLAKAPSRFVPTPQRITQRAGSPAHGPPGPAEALVSAVASPRHGRTLVGLTILHSAIDFADPLRAR